MAQDNISLFLSSIGESHVICGHVSFDLYFNCFD